MMKQNKTKSLEQDKELFHHREIKLIRAGSYLRDFSMLLF